MPTQQRMLIVDDDPINLKIMQEIIADHYDYELAHDGEEALEIVHRYRPDVILLDIMMPGIDGYEVCRRIRSNERYSFIKIILVSGKASVQERLAGYEAGADDYLTKPFNDEELLAKIRVFLQLKRTEEVDEIKTRLLSVFSHETRTPLTGIIGMAELMRDAGDLTQPQEDNVQVIIDSGHRLLSLVQQTELLCILKAGIRINPARVAFETKVLAAMEKIQPRADQKQITFHVDIDPVFSLHVDWVFFKYVVDILLDNAVKFASDETTVSVLAKNVKSTSVSVIQVVDEGPGVNEEWMEHIFDEFAVKDVMHHKKGYGMHLAIARHIVAHHGGTISVANRPDKGAVFSIAIPHPKS